ncbi:hypothetical protein HHI36_004695 [Cryptolaemus montrouzieri]|uniref:Uncharacterized protein n=1 Tax=Cryptolaemus montrouzieri TaxID=559131 RepID=A0ABD2NSQ6_9CUCU
MAEQCRGRKRCRNCGSEHDEAQCDIVEAECIFCKMNHSAVDRICPEYGRQKKIKEAMAVYKYTYYEGNTLYKTNLRNIYTSLRKFPNLKRNDKYINDQEDYNKIPVTITRRTFSQVLKDNKDKSQQANSSRKITTHSVRERPQPQQKDMIMKNIENI